jgi:Tfp pilus assembly protein PilN
MSLLPNSGARKSAAVNINLVPKDPFFDTIIGKTLRWALFVGRYIVIFVELFVILSFAARFSLDRQVTDLNDQLFQKEQVISSYGDLESTIRLTQYKIDQYQQIDQQANLSEVFPTLSKITPTGVTMEELIIKPTSINMSGRAISQNSLNILISNLQLSSQFHTVSVERIEVGDNQEPGFDFKISAGMGAVAPVTATPTKKK